MTRSHPDPTKWPTLVAKIKKASMEFKGFARDDPEPGDQRCLS